MKVLLTLAALLAFSGLASANHRTNAAGGCNGSQAVSGGCSGSQGSGGLFHRAGGVLAGRVRRHQEQAPAVSVQSTTVIRAQPLPKGPANCTCGVAGCPAMKP